MFDLAYFLRLFNDYLGFITLLVGFFAIYLYLKQKKDHKRGAASLILQEIRYAEQKIRKYRDVRVYKLSDKLLPTNSWNNNIHLFIKELGEVQNIDLISEFYAKVSYIDNLIATISKQQNNLKQILIPQNVSANQAVPPIGGPQLPSPTAMPNIKIIQMPPVSQQILDDVSMDVEFIYNTPIVEKLRKISERKWYQII
jgi:hypothetical protein